MLRYNAFLTALRYGRLDLLAESPAEAKEKVHACYERGQVDWFDEELTDVEMVLADRTYEVTEVCPWCDKEITMTWNTDARGYKAFCPVCGKRLMLCDECMHSEDYSGCDYDSATDSCKRNKKGDR